jgi:hypothetical protein
VAIKRARTGSVHGVGKTPSIPPRKATPFRLRARPDDCCACATRLNHENRTSIAREWYEARLEVPLPSQCEYGRSNSNGSRQTGSMAASQPVRCRRLRPNTGETSSGAYLLAELVRANDLRYSCRLGLRGSTQPPLASECCAAQRILQLNEYLLSIIN